MSSIHKATRGILHPLTLIAMLVLAAVSSQLGNAQNSATDVRPRLPAGEGYLVAATDDFFDEEEDDEDDFSMTIEELDALENLPGGLGALPDEIPVNPDNPQTLDKI